MPACNIESLPADTSPNPHALTLPTKAKAAQTHPDKLPDASAEK